MAYSIHVSLDEIYLDHEFTILCLIEILFGMTSRVVAEWIRALMFLFISRVLGSSPGRGTYVLEQNTLSF